MSDSYQAIYDAVRSRISGGNISDAVSSALNGAFDFSHARAMLQEQIWAIGCEMVRPSVVYRPSIAMDGSKWCALYGDDLMHGVSGFGDTPADAMQDFDQNWLKQRTPAAVVEKSQAFGQTGDER